MTDQTTSERSSGGDRGGTILHLCSERASVLDRFVRIAHALGAEVRLRDDEACTVAFRGSAVSAARAVHAVCMVRDDWPVDVRAAVVHALDVDALTAPAISFFSVRDDDRLLAIGALKQLDPTAGEIFTLPGAIENARSSLRSSLGREVIKRRRTIEMAGTRTTTTSTTTAMLFPHG